MACAARSLHSALEFADKFDIDKAHEGYEALAKDPNVEVVYVGSINTTHLALVKLFLDNGKHVLCEKPLGMNVKEVKEMLTHARQKKLFLMEAIWSRVQPAYLKMREEIEKGTIGDIVQVLSESGAVLKADRVRKKDLGGGSMLDIGIYCLQFSQFVFNGERPYKVSAAGHKNYDGVDQSVSATMLYAGGRTASFQTNIKVRTSCEATVYGTKGKMKLSAPFGCASKMEMPDGSVLEFPLPKGKYDFNFPNSAGLGFEAQHVRECLKLGLWESPKVSHAESLLIAELLEDIRKQVGVKYPQD